ncbi:MAG: four helix bundle protein [Blastocatellia bacterium]
MESYRELVVWQKGMALVVAVYRMTATFPKSETFGLAGQIQRAAVSIPSNIAEGNALRQTKAYLRHLAIACGSLAELETQLEIAERLGYLSDRTIALQANEIGRMLNALRQKLEAKL